MTTSFPETPDFLFKIVLVGNSAVGKSSLFRVVTEGHWGQDQSFYPTIGVDFKIHTFRVDGKVVKLQMWDTAGQERFKSICKTYYKGTHGTILVYDITDRTTFTDIENWTEDVEKMSREGSAKILVGNKCDLEDSRRVSFEEGKRLADRLGMMFIETSAKTNHNVTNLFQQLARDMKERVEKDVIKIGSISSSNDKKIEVGDDMLKQEKKYAPCCNT